jgi:pimeloyl-ACP methyl ester carboxylesterase
MTGQDTQITLRGGRIVGLHELWRPDQPSRTVIFCHAAPGAGSFDPDPAETRARGVRLLAPDRPGYGSSQPVVSGEWASVERAADDIAQILGQLAIDRVSVVGWSAGGRIALALTARHPELVERVGVVATPAPDDAVPWIPTEQRHDLEALRGKPPDAVHAALAQAMGGLVPADPADPDAFGLVGGPEVDAPILEREGVRDRLTEMIREAFVQGPTGMAADIAGYALQPWGFEPSDVRQKTLLVYGGADPQLPSRHGPWWQQQLPDARLEMVPNVGHLVIVPMWKRLLSFLAPR